jgi:hypothetical protein
VAIPARVLTLDEAIALISARVASAVVAITPHLPASHGS